MSNNPAQPTPATPPPDPHSSHQSDPLKILHDSRTTPPHHSLAPFAAVDCETSGLDPNIHEALTVGVVLADRQLNELAHIHLYILPERLADANLESLVVAGYDPGLWQREGVTAQRAVEILGPWLAGRQLIAHSIDFDLGFLGKLFRAGRKNAPWSFRHHCTLKAMRQAIKAGAVRSKGASLVAACEAFSVPLDRREGQPHSALDDARAGLAVAKALALKGFMRF